MWTVIDIVTSEKKAQSAQEKLMMEGFLVKILPLRQNKCYQILVPEEEAKEAYHVLVETGLS
ncbi:hypothetical protein [Garciella nitratireducens]|uniref:Signal transducing protein n=1 Tax=Garciella nitratireducens DSM 15102 TaxID=1121911 RepID=A0A1T4NS26_9FIRM|nr:hypothetical protein [Garciella nitratireducens]SJZ81982.1 hypothetical protein SAMN02745973_01789 [Garciella nitratireducens DSM 15102]